MPKVPAIPPLYLWGGAAALAALFLLTRKGIAESLARGAIGAAEGLAVGTVKGAGQVIGIPDTNDRQCTLDLAAGNYGAASASCPAPRFFRVAVLGQSDFEVEKQKFINSGA